MGSQWKALERSVANVLGGKRLYRGSDFSQEAPDVIIPVEGDPRYHTIVAECKYRTYMPGFRKLVDHNIVMERESALKAGKILITKIKCKNHKSLYYTLTIEDFKEYFFNKKDHIIYESHEIKPVSNFYSDAFTQAQEYPETFLEADKGEVYCIVAAHQKQSKYRLIMFNTLI